MEREITITVTDDEARRIDELVESGAYASAEAVVHAAILGFEFAPPIGLSDEILRRLVHEAAANPVRYSSEEIRQHLREHHRLRTGGAGAKIAR